jgi:hypothetical protein
MIIIEDEEIIVPINITKKVKLDFDFQNQPIKNIFDRDFWCMQQVHIKGQMYGYSKNTRLLFALCHNVTDNIKFMKLIAWKNKQGKFIPSKQCNKDIINWCKMSGIKV